MKAKPCFNCGSKLSVFTGRCAFCGWPNPIFAGVAAAVAILICVVLICIALDWTLRGDQAAMARVNNPLIKYQGRTN